MLCSLCLSLFRTRTDIQATKTRVPPRATLLYSIIPLIPYSNQTAKKLILSRLATKCKYFHNINFDFSEKKLQGNLLNLSVVHIKSNFVFSVCVRIVFIFSKTKHSLNTSFSNIIGTPSSCVFFALASSKFSMIF